MNNLSIASLGAAAATGTIVLIGTLLRRRKPQIKPESIKPEIKPEITAE